MLFECPIYSRSWEIEKLQEKLRLLWIFFFFLAFQKAAVWYVCLIIVSMLKQRKGSD